MALLFDSFMLAQNKFFALRAFILSFLPAAVQLRINFVHDALIGMIYLLTGRVLPSLRPYLNITRATSNKLSGKNVIVTGANSGIGKQIATDLLRLGATVHIACRNEKKGQDAIEDLLWSLPGARPRLHLLPLDTSDLTSVRSFADKWSKRSASKRHIDVLVHNAGIAVMPTDPKSQYSPDGFELMYATNFLGSFVLTNLLEEYLAEDARVIFTSSAGQYSARQSKTFATTQVKDTVETGFHISKTGPQTPLTNGLEKSGFEGAQKTIKNSDRYGQTKLMQSIFAKLLQQHWNKQTQTANSHESRTDSHINETRKRRTAHSFSPGFTITPIFEKLPKGGIDLPFQILKFVTAFGTDVAEGSATGTWLASADDEQIRKGGEYWDRMTRRVSPADLMSQSQLERYWARWQADGDVQWN